MSEWIPLSSVGDWTQAIGRLARTGAHYGTILYFILDDGSTELTEVPVRVVIWTHHGLTTVAVADCQMLVRKGEHLNDSQP